MAELKKLKDIKLDAKLKGTIASGYQSDDSTAELLVAEPLQEHPEIKGLYRAFDPDTNWRTWVEYTPPTATPTPPTQAQKDRADYNKKIQELKEKQELINLGVFTEAEADISTLKGEIKTLYNKVNS